MKIHFLVNLELTIFPTKPRKENKEFNYVFKINSKLRYWVKFSAFGIFHTFARVETFLVAKYSDMLQCLCTLQISKNCNSELCEKKLIKTYGIINYLDIIILTVITNV